ncbi:hypothetical protein M409DRAFT_30290 [Zasmidium cellare ATCC 36951]|uniref:BTB domain-containing protein n=1 Tax=Zasmidium cellare ATCC 36951 TaxID=1080233 RepID=A0A6A6BXG1_ZASCE|nr:uncharacterized protein M409DRAFT_30290 [Zasmidium cellare ATCC 36951]KAF2159283.1 hypothetical protein M409DRAFT_30290 [Zasmidium cellare ATCC 36951]
MTLESESSWSFADLPDSQPAPSADQQQQTRPDRPRPSRHSSLPRTLFGSGVTSIFGGPSTAEPTSNMQRHHSEDVVVGEPALSTLRSPAMKEPQYSAESSVGVNTRLIPRVEKDADDPTTPPVSSRNARHESTTLTTLSRLFAVQAATSPEHSRNPSYNTSTRNAAGYTRALHSAETAALPDHLYTRGLLGGRHSDITVHAFGRPYKLHRLVLDRAPFFASALSEPWLEANAKEMTVHPEDMDSSITQEAFELALKRLYGSCNLDEEDQIPVGLFATGCWLEMQDLIDSSIESMLRQMTPGTLAPLIKLVTSNYYGRAGDKILASAKSMLCRDGWRMPLRCWDGIPGDIIREIVGGDGFFVDGEWDRWALAKRLLDRRLKTQAIAADLLEPGSRRKVRKAPDAANLMAVRFDTIYRKSGAGTGRGVPDSLHKWISLYIHPDVEPLLVLLDEGIHYVHLDFEQLQFIRSARDCLGLPVLPEKVISNALWQQMELRQKVMNAREVELELGVSVQCAEDTAMDASRDTTMSILSSSEPVRPKGKRRATEADEVIDDIDSGSWDGNGKPRKFWIPSSDCNLIMGGNAEPIIATSNNTTMQRHASRLSATIQPEDVQWAADFTAATSHPRPPLSMGDSVAQGQNGPVTVSYTHFPPFRFAAEFPNPRLLKEKKRVYSRTVFYAGSLWNIYIQKVASSRSKQLGVYLHRAKERETEEVIAGTAGLAQGSVDERIGQLEREMILRSERRDRRQHRRTTIGSDGAEGDGTESSGSAGVEDGAIPGAASSSGTVRSSTMREYLARGHRKTGQTDLTGTSPPTLSDPFTGGDDMITPESELDSSDSESERWAATSNRFHVPTLPPYVDARPTIKTYFKIYSPSRGGRMLSVYESAPDKFNFSQSWGWKSSTLMLDEGLLGDDTDDMKDDVDGVGEREGTSRRTMKGKGDGKLRFMVVIGNI